MFRNKYLKQLQDIQSRIKNCKAYLAKLDPPAPPTSKMGVHLVYWLEALFLDRKVSISEIFSREFAGSENETCDYLRQLGEYFVNVSDYEREKREFEKEVGQLQKRKPV